MQYYYYYYNQKPGPERHSPVAEQPPNFLDPTTGACPPPHNGQGPKTHDARQRNDGGAALLRISARIARARAAFASASASRIPHPAAFRMPRTSVLTSHPAQSGARAVHTAKGVPLLLRSVASTQSAVVGSTGLAMTRYAARAVSRSSAARSASVAPSRSSHAATAAAHARNDQKPACASTTYLMMTMNYSCEPLPC